MSDEMKPISEDETNAAGDAPRRDSAQAAALTVGSPSSSSEQEIKHDGARSAASSGAAALSLSTKVGIAVVAVVSALFIGVSAFSITGGFGLPADSPAVQFAERIGIVSTSQVEARVEAPEVENAHESASSKADEKHEAEKEEATDENADDSQSSDSSDSSGEDGSNLSSSADSSNGSGASDGDSFSTSNGPSDSNPNAANSSSSGSSNSDSAPLDTITVYVSVSSSSVSSPVVSGGGTFTFSKKTDDGKERKVTPYDALCACGLSVNAIETNYGTYVAAIGGLAEKEHGASSGWMYSVNGAVPMTACSNYTLSNGDSVSWYYVTG